MAKLKAVLRSDGRTYGWQFYCPGCETTHMYTTLWKFDGDLDEPSFTPSLKIYGATPDVPAGHRWPQCHFYLTKGKLIYCPDSEHGLAGKTVELPEWKESIA